MVLHDDTGAPPCRLAEPWAEHGDRETGHREAIPGGKTFIWSLMADVSLFFWRAPVGLDHTVGHPR